MVKLVKNNREKQDNASSAKYPKLTLGIFKNYLTAPYKNSATPLSNVFFHYPLSEIKRVAKELPDDLRENAEKLISNYEKNNSLSENTSREFLSEQEEISDPIALRKKIHEEEVSKRVIEIQIKVIEAEIESLTQKIEECFNDLEEKKERKSYIDSKIAFFKSHCTTDLVWDLEYLCECYFVDKYFLNNYKRISEIKDVDYEKWINIIWNDFSDSVGRDKIIAISKIIAYCVLNDDKENLMIYCPSDVFEEVKKYVPDMKKENFITQ